MSRTYSFRLLLACLFVVLLGIHCPSTAQVAKPSEGIASAPAAPATQAVTLVKGPYLQAPRTDGMVICLEPSEDTAGKVIVKDTDGRPVVEKPFRAAAGKVARIDITGLKPATTYPYEILLDGSAQPAAQATLTTMPPPGQLPVTFLVTGDSRTHADRFHDICQAMLKTHIPLFVHSGDFVNVGPNLSAWNPQFFDPARELLANAVVLPAVGNHELAGNGPAGEKIYGDFFVLPDGKNYYSVDYGGVHLIILDSNRRDFEGSDQYKWLVHDLSTCKAPWKVAVFHHPWFDAGYHASQLAMRRLYDPLFVKYGVDLIVVGHDHNYQRTRPIIHLFDPKSDKPYWQVVSGGAGAPPYPVLKAENYVEKCSTVNHFLTITADKDRLIVVATAVNGTQIDRFEIQKNKPAEHPIAFEQIELEDAIRAWLSKRSFLFTPAQQSATITVPTSNPYPVPVKIQFTATDTETWQITTSPAEITLPPGTRSRPATLDVQLTLRPVDQAAAAGERFIGVNATYQAPQIGSGFVKTIRVALIRTGSPASRPAPAR